MPLSLDNLDQLNALGGKSVYLTSTTDITTGPKWLEGLAPDAQGVIRDAVTSVIVVVEKQDQGVVDAFYFYFYAFNWGGVVLGKQLGMSTLYPPPPPLSILFLSPYLFLGHEVYIYNTYL